MAKVLNPTRRESSYFDGPAIEKCPSYEALKIDAQLGSASLLRAIQRAGLRP